MNENSLGDFRFGGDGDEWKVKEFRQQMSNRCQLRLLSAKI